MPTEKYVLEADVKQMVSAQQAIIKNQGRMIQEMRKTGKATESVGKKMTTVGQTFKRDLMGMAVGFVGVQAAIGGAKAMLTKLAEEMKRARQETTSFVQELAPLVSVGAGGPKAVAEIHRLAQREGVSREEITEATVHLGAAVPGKTLRQRLLGEALEMKPVFPKMTTRDISAGLVEFVLAAGGEGTPAEKAQRAQNVALYLQQGARGEFGQLTKYGGRGVGQLVGLGVAPPRALGMFAVGTRAPGLTGELTATGLRAIAIRAMERKGAAWERFGVPEKAGPWAGLGAVAGALERGEITERDLVGLFGAEGLPVALQVLGNWSAVQREADVARGYIGPGAPDWGAIRAAEHYAEPAARTARTKAQIVERGKADRWAARERTGRWEVAGDLYRADWQRFGQGTMEPEERATFMRHVGSPLEMLHEMLWGGGYLGQAGRLLAPNAGPQVAPADTGTRPIALYPEPLGEE